MGSEHMDDRVATLERALAEAQEKITALESEQRGMTEWLACTMAAGDLERVAVDLGVTKPHDVVTGIVIELGVDLNVWMRQESAAGRVVREMPAEFMTVLKRAIETVVGRAATRTHLRIEWQKVGA